MKYMKFIQKSSKLKKLELNINNDHTWDDYDMISKINKFLIFQSSFKNIKVLKISAPNIFNEHIEKLIIQLENLEALKYNTDIKNHKDYLFIQNIYIKNSDNGLKKKLKKLSLRYNFENFTKQISKKCLNA